MGREGNAGRAEGREMEKIGIRGEGRRENGRRRKGRRG